MESKVNYQMSKDAFHFHHNLSHILRYLQEKKDDQKHLLLYMYHFQNNHLLQQNRIYQYSQQFFLQVLVFQQ